MDVSYLLLRTLGGICHEDAGIFKNRMLLINQSPPHVKRIKSFFMAGESVRKGSMTFLVDLNRLNFRFK